MTDKLAKVNKMIRILWNEKVIAESRNCIKVEGNYYFPPADVKKEFLAASELTTFCPWKGKAGYYSLQVDGEENRDAAWYYAEPREEALPIKGYIAFWNVTVEEN